MKKKYFFQGFIKPKKQKIRYLGNFQKSWKSKRKWISEHFEKSLTHKREKTLAAASKRYIALYKDWIEPACAGFKRGRKSVTKPSEMLKFICVWPEGKKRKPEKKSRL